MINIPDASDCPYAEETIMFRFSWPTRHGLALGALGPWIAVSMIVPANGAPAASCKMTDAQIAAVATLPNPVTRNETGAFVRDAKAMSDYEVENMCLTRRYFDMVAARRASGRKLKTSDVSYYAIEYLTAPECVLVRHDSNVARHGGVPEDAKFQAENEASCEREAGLPLRPSL
jgi:hypothetical protein